jgi:hypothetical protein
MTAKSAICSLLLAGHTLNIKNCFNLVGITNCPREISRQIERPFGVEIKRTERTGTSRFKQPVRWIDYTLERTLDNAMGILKMEEYVKLNPMGMNDDYPFLDQQ